LSIATQESKPACFKHVLQPIVIDNMGLPSEPVTLTVAQLDELNRRLSTMRHDINNNLSLIVAAVELIRHKPQMTEKMMVTLSEQPSRIGEALSKFSREFERVLGITKP
jgi:hypothetical protein